MSTVALTQLLGIAYDGGSLAQALAATSAAAVLDAANQDLIQVIHLTAGVVGADWAVNRASGIGQRDHLTVQLTRAGRTARSAS
jgi:hypothetical protein